MLGLINERACNAREPTLYMFDTLAVFHLLMSALNVGLAVGEGLAMLVTSAVFQPTMSPYVDVAVLGLVAHAVMAASMLASEMGMSALAAGTASSIVAKAASHSDPLPQSSLLHEKRDTASLRRGRQTSCMAPKRSGDAAAAESASLVGAILDDVIGGLSVRGTATISDCEGVIRSLSS